MVSEKQKQSISAIQSVRPVSVIDRITYLISNRQFQWLFIVVIAASFYANSVPNNFTFDDQQYYFANQYVLQGVNGIYDLFTKESMYGFYGQASQLSGGRWRPLSLITFALEKEYFNANPYVSHFINLLLFIITAILMLSFLRRFIFKTSPVMAFLTVLLFVVHPIHTDAVSHIKSRDELLSWLFLLLTMYCSMNFLIKRNFWQLLLAMLFYFLALLSKENGIMFILILPLTFYFFTKEKPRLIALTMIPFILVLTGYLVMRFSFINVSTNAGTDVLYAPYAFASHGQKLATELMLLGKYILLLFWPNTLVCDYSYSSVQYVNFSDWHVWLSMLINIALLVYAILKVREKSPVAYGILFYFCGMAIVSNIFIDVGTFIGERFLYQPSFGFCIAVIAIGNKVVSKIGFKNTLQKFSALSTLILLVLTLSGFQTIARNTEWYDNLTLFNADVKKVPNNFLIRESLGNIFMNLGISAATLEEHNDDLERAIGEFDTAGQIYSQYIITRYDIGDVYLRLGDTVNAKKAFLRCVNEQPDYAMGYSGLGAIYYADNNYQRALYYYKKSIQLAPYDAQFYYNTGLCYHWLGQYENEVEAYEKTLSLGLTPAELTEHTLDMQTVRQNLAIAEKLIQDKSK